MATQQTQPLAGKKLGSLLLKPQKMSSSKSLSEFGRDFFPTQAYGLERLERHFAGDFRMPEAEGLPERYSDLKEYCLS